MSDSDRAESQPAHRPRLDRRTLGAVDEVLDGKYRLLRPLKRGSMGALYAAENVTLGVPVAVKVLRTDVSPETRAEIAKRMVQEAHAAFLVDHPAILRVLDVGTTPEGDPYVVMELLRGKTLGAALTEHGRVDPAQAVRALLPIAHGLVAAHACGVIHRDLKPNNVFLARTRDGRTQPKIIDFGLARPLLGQGPRITQTGNAMGSPTYMAPEQIRGANVTELADLWGFTVMLYELIHGEPPFADETLEGLFQQILGATPQSLCELGRVDEALWAIIAKGLCKAPADRWANMRELGAALAAWLVERGYRDDVCGASLEAVWLRAPRLGGKIEVLATDSKAELPMPKRRRRPSFSDISTGRWTPVRLRRRPWLLVVLSVLALGAVGLAVASLLDVPLPSPTEAWRNAWPEASGSAAVQGPASLPSAPAPSATASQQGGAGSATTASVRPPGGTSPAPTASATQQGGTDAAPR